ncbi:GNAT family N-acetyltransferase [Trujillonella humicola]|uniref:GNAT family N-acetyltransferase n=1 Tax=Trujillonella humicola TaxID=3383699 RepID=UPI003906D3FB
MAHSGLFDCIEQYHAAAPLPDGRIERVGGLDVPVVAPAWPYPARPRPGGAPVTTDDVRAAMGLQEASGLPVALEWIWERSGGTAAAAREAGLTVEYLPLLVLDTAMELLLPHGVRLYLVGAEDPQLPRYQRLAELAFATPSGSTGGAATVEERVAAGPRTEVLRERIATGRTVMMVAVEDGEPVAVGSHQPLDVDGREVSEITGVATLPRLRGRGLGAGLTSALAEHARETADLVFLTAGDDDVARVYERVGFAWIGTTGVADLPS